MPREVDSIFQQEIELFNVGLQIYIYVVAPHKTNIVLGDFSSTVANDSQTSEN